MEQDTKEEVVAKKEEKKEKKILSENGPIIDILKKALQWNRHEYGGKKEVLK